MATVFISSARAAVSSLGFAAPAVGAGCSVGGGEAGAGAGADVGARVGTDVEGAGLLAGLKFSLLMGLVKPRRTADGKSPL